MRSMCRVLIKKKHLQCTTKTVNLHVRLTQIVLEQVPCRWSSSIHNNNNNNNQDNVYGDVIMAEPLREFTQFI